MINAIRWNNGTLQMQTAEHKTWQDVPKVAKDIGPKPMTATEVNEQLRKYLDNVCGIPVEGVLEENEGKAEEISNLRAELARTVSRNVRARDLLQQVSDLFGSLDPMSRVPSFEALKKTLDGINTALRGK